MTLSYLSLLLTLVILAGGPRPQSENCKLVLAILNAEGNRSVPTTAPAQRGKPGGRATLKTFKVGDAAADCDPDRDCGKMLPVGGFLSSSDAGADVEFLADGEECTDGHFNVIRGISDRCIDQVQVTLTGLDAGYAFNATLEPGRCGQGGDIYLCGPGPSGQVTRVDGGWKVVVSPKPF